MRIKNARLFPTAITYGKNSPVEPFVSVLVKATFRLESRREPARVADEQFPVFTADAPYDPENPAGPLEFESDLVPFKPRADIVLVGKAHAPYSRPVRSLDVTIQVGATRRVLRVFGDRAWSFTDPRAVAPLIAGPAEFVEMPLTYDRAFGGVDERAGLDPEVPSFRPWCEWNYLGRGFCGARTVESIDRKPLPNVEDPENLVRSWDSRPLPVGCGFFPRNSKPRSLFAGTYDDKWKATRAPEPPEDFRFDLYNGADRSLQVPNYLAGNEFVSLENVTPGGGPVEFWLPCLVPGVTIERADGKEPLAVRANLDTLVLVPDARRFYLVWRAVVGVERPDATDLLEARIDYTESSPGPELAARRGGYRA
ncbi:MAG TPA: DUF2169 domain-containing protein [Polyangiaceae bacterium]|nr:DUF2169 domain-containing protein [Polyangiaceae bacterium]